MTFGVGAGAIGLLRAAASVLTVAVVLLLRWLWGPTVWVALPIAALIGLWYRLLPRWVASVYGALTERGVYLRCGVWWRREITVPLDALRTFETWVPPLHALFRCRTVVLRFAGGCVWLPFLAEDTAQALTARLEDV